MLHVCPRSASSLTSPGQGMGAQCLGHNFIPSQEAFPGEDTLLLLLLLFVPTCFHPGFLAPRHEMTSELDNSPPA